MRTITYLYFILIGNIALPHYSWAQDYTLDDWMTISSVNAFEWSPDGQYFYYTSNAAASGTYNIFRMSSNGGRPMLLGEDEVNIRPERREQLTLSPDGKNIFFSAASYFSAYLNIYRMSATGGIAEALTYNDGMIQTSPSVSPDNETLAFFARMSSGAKLFTLDLTNQTAWPRQLLPGEGSELFPIWSSKGDLAFQRRGDIWVKQSKANEPFQLIDPAYGGGNSGIAWSPEGDRIAFTNSRSGYSQVGVVEIDTGNVITITDTPVEHGQISWSPDGRWLAYVKADDVGMSNDIVIASADGSGHQKILTSGKGKRFEPKFSPDGEFIAYIESNSVRSRDIWKIPVEGGVPEQVTHSMGMVDPADLTEAQEIFYQARDTLRIPGMLWLPPDFDASKKYPVIVRLHGHPGQWNHDFRMMTQYFVNKGFVVVAPNPRGSAGFGQGFHDLHIADWGGEEFYDAMGVVKFLETLGYADTNNMATWGGSGGGFMSMTIATKAPIVFKAQIIRAPVVGWKVLVDERHDASGRAWTATRTPSRSRADMGGSYEEIPEEYDLRSPINFVEAVQVPQLLFHGLRDTNVLPRQSRMWVNRMQELGKDDLIEFITYPDEDHSLRRYKSTVRDRLARMTLFLSEKLNLPELK